MTKKSVVKRFVIEDPKPISNLCSILDEEEGRVEEYWGAQNPVFIYHIGDSTLAVECYNDEYKMEDGFYRFEFAMAASDSEILNRDFKIFLGYLHKVNPDYDVSQIKQQDY